MPETQLRVSTRSPSQWGRVLSIEIPRARFDSLRESVVRDLRRRVTRPGFRTGHVPRALVERDFAGRIESTTLEKLIPELCGEAIERESLDVISPPRVQNLVLDDPEVVRFDVEVDVRPEIELQPFDGLQGTRRLTAVEAAHVDRALGEIREQWARFEGVDREARDGDFVQVSYVPLDAAGQEVASQKVENYPFQVGAGNVVPEFETAVRGKRAGETGGAEVRYGDDHADPDLAGKLVAFILTVQAVKEKRLPELDDEFAKDLGAESLEALQQRVREDLEKRVQDESERDLRDSLVDALLQRNTFEAPRSMVERYLEILVGEYDERRQRAHLPPDEEERRKFAESIRPAADRSVRRQLLLDRVAETQSLYASEEDVDKWIEDRVEAGGPEATRMRAFFSDKQRRRQLRSELTDQRVFDFLKSRAEIRDIQTPVAPEAV